MQNIEIETIGNTLTIKIDLSKRGKKSASGKSTMIATTEGNKVVQGDIRIGINCYELVK